MIVVQIKNDIEFLGSDGWNKYDEHILIDMYPNKEYTEDDIINNLIIKRSWSQIKKKAKRLGLSRAKGKAKKFSKEFLINEIKRFHEENGRSPRCEDFCAMKGYPSVKVYAKYFGGWNNALKLANVELNLINDYSKQEIMNNTIEFYKNNNRSPYYNELGYSQSIIRKYWDNWNELIKECDLPLNKREIHIETNEEALELLNILHIENNKIPTTYDLESIGIHRGWFTSKFGSFKQALFEAGLITEYELNLDYDKMASNSIKYLHDLASDINRVPTVQEFEEYLSTLPSKDWLGRRNLCERLKSTFVEICEEHLPFEILNSELNNFYLNKKGERCQSLPEMKISNLLIDNNIDYDYQTMYKDVMEIDKNYRFDWVIKKDGINFYVEYFGLFDEENDDYDIIRTYNEKTHTKISLCEQNNLILIELYPEDMKQNMNGIINKFKNHGIILELYNVA